MIFIVSAAAFCAATAYGKFTSETAGPVISMDSDEVTVSVNDEESAILAGVTAQNSEGVYLTDSLVVESMSNFISTGVREATIAACDSNNNVRKITRRVVYSDYTHPAVALSGPLEASVSDSSALLDVITVTDCLDGDLTGQVQIVFEDSSQGVEAGEFPMHIQVSNSAGDTLNLPVTVRFYNASEEAYTPQLTLTEYIIYVEEGADVDPEAYLDTITLDNEIYTWDSESGEFLSEETAGDDRDYWEEVNSISRSEVSIDDPVDTSKAGTYEVIYSFTDDGSGMTGKVRLVVVVEEE